MTTKHTPGPWYADKIQDRSAYNIFVPGHCEALLTLEPGKYDGASPLVKNVEADARLIAAAPELLEALKLAVDALHAAFDYVPAGHADAACRANLVPTLQNARGAIAKATA